ncbi:kinesin-3 [Phtheirospermum japonicum]|uniref:Kinesin-3 n=1 Tax=Phtheirospermum japonicum TaxID=374723 RepID=A0A830D5H1_9LAMI|nr:kinesin-3 [Phtheirospermum japonicum]
MPPNTSTRAQTRQAFLVVNGGQDLPTTGGPLSISDSDYGLIEFNKEGVEALVNEKLRIKYNFNYKV